MVKKWVGLALLPIFFLLCGNVAYTQGYEDDVIDTQRYFDFSVDQWERTIQYAFEAQGHITNSNPLGLDFFQDNLEDCSAYYSIKQCLASILTIDMADTSVQRWHEQQTAENVGLSLCESSGYLLHCKDEANMQEHLTSHDGVTSFLVHNYNYCYIFYSLISSIDEQHVYVVSLLVEPLGDMQDEWHFNRVFYTLVSALTPRASFEERHALVEQLEVILSKLWDVPQELPVEIDWQHLHFTVSSLADGSFAISVRPAVVLLVE